MWDETAHDASDLSGDDDWGSWDILTSNKSVIAALEVDPLLVWSELEPEPSICLDYIQCPEELE
jgi:hypothetical protein